MSLTSYAGDFSKAVQPFKVVLGFIVLIGIGAGYYLLVMRNKK
jgi:hypothetical protein